MPGTHIIRRQVLEVAVAGTESDGFALQRRLPEMCQHGLMPALDRVLERLVPAHEHWIVDRLEVDAGTLSFENLERDLVEAVIQAITKLLRERAPTGTATGSTGQIDRRTEPDPAPAHPARTVPSMIVINRIRLKPSPRILIPP